MCVCVWLCVWLCVCVAVCVCVCVCVCVFYVYLYLCTKVSQIYIQSIVPTPPPSSCTHGTHPCSKHGAWSLMSYFYMTSLQIIPGFFNFLSSRILLFLAFGPSQMRERQLRRRKELLGMYIKNKRITAKNHSAIG